MKRIRLQIPVRRRFVQLGAWAGLALAAWTAADGAPSFGVRLTPIGTHLNGPPYDTASAQIVAHDKFRQRLFVVNALAARIDVLDIKDPTQPTKVAALDLSPFGDVALSVAFRPGLIAASVMPADKTDPGTVVFFDPHLRFLRSLPVGALPDMITFTPNGRHLLVANEGEPNSYDDFDLETLGPSVDPEGSVSIIDLAQGVKRAVVRTATFTAFNHVPLDPGIRIYGPNATVAQDLEPESIAVSDDSRTAWVVLQENNALATIDIRSATVTRIDALGLKDHSLPGQGLDASDRDNTIHIANWPLLGIYTPDAMSAFKVRGQTYLALANEGDARDYPGFAEVARVGTLTLDPTLYPDAATLQANTNLGRLNVSKVGADPDGDGDVDVLQPLGGRSFSIRTVTGELVFDSGDAIEQLTAALYPTNFNASDTSNARDARSASRGPEPEGLTIGKLHGHTLAFIALERMGGIVVYDLSDPRAPVLLDYVNNRTFANPFDFATAGDLGPEGMVFIPAGHSPNRQALLVVANETSGTTTIFQVDRVKGGPGSSAGN